MALFPHLNPLSRRCNAAAVGLPGAGRGAIVDGAPPGAMVDA